MTIIDVLLRTAYEDTQLLFKNDSLGDQFAIPRDVEFLLVAKDEFKASTVCSFINDNQYGIARVDDGFNIFVVVRMSIEQNILCSVSALMACLGEMFDVEYDGCGCELQKVT
jgi:hypothetical protein